MTNRGMQGSVLLLLALLASVVGLNAWLLHRILKDELAALGVVEHPGVPGGDGWSTSLPIVHTPPSKAVAAQYGIAHAFLCGAPTWDDALQSDMAMSVVDGAHPFGWIGQYVMKPHPGISYGSMGVLGPGVGIDAGMISKSVWKVPFPKRNVFVSFWWMWYETKKGTLGGANDKAGSVLSVCNADNSRGISLLTPGEETKDDQGTPIKHYPQLQAYNSGSSWRIPCYIPGTVASWDHIVINFAATVAADGSTSLAHDNVTMWYNGVEVTFGAAGGQSSVSIDALSWGLYQLRFGYNCTTNLVCSSTTQTPKYNHVPIRYVMWGADAAINPEVIGILRGWAPSVT